MKTFRKIVPVFMLLCLVVFPYSSFAADGPSDVALILQKAFSHPDAPLLENLYDFTWYKGIWAGYVGADTYIFSAGQWTVITDPFWTLNAGGDWARTVWEAPCAGFGMNQLDLATVQTTAFTGSRPSFHLKDFSGGIPAWERRDVLDFRFYGTSSPIANESCIFMYLTGETQSSPGQPPERVSDSLGIILPDPERPGVFPISQSEPIYVNAFVLLRNGSDGLLDGFIPFEEEIRGIEFARNNRGTLAFMIATGKRMYLVEFEREGMVFNSFPSP